MTKKKAVEIVVDPGNARVHDERNQKVIQESLRELGAGRSIVIDQPAKNEHHPTQKPLECMARPIRNHGKPGDIVYDPFLGSGTTLLAADQLERVCYGLEIDPGYCDVIISRYCAMKEIDPEAVYSTAMLEGVTK